jgi:nicotinamidase-related amidase
MVQGGRDEEYRAGETALLLVDMQRVWVEPGLDPAHPERGPDHYFYRETAERTIPNQLRLLRAARSAGVEVVHTIIESLTKDGRDRSLDHKLSGIHVPHGAPEGRIIPALAPLPDEIVLPKTSSGVFNSTAIDYVLRNLGIRYLIVGGVLTDQCVDMAVRDAADRGYIVTCVADACAAPSRERHEAALRAFSGYCWTADAATVIVRFKTIKRPSVQHDQASKRRTPMSDAPSHGMTPLADGSVDD